LILSPHTGRPTPLACSTLLAQQTSVKDRSDCVLTARQFVWRLRDVSNACGGFAKLNHRETKVTYFFGSQDSMTLFSVHRVTTSRLSQRACLSRSLEGTMTSSVSLRCLLQVLSRSMSKNKEAHTLPREAVSGSCRWLLRWC
jgi:hypothetical protein